MDNPFRADAGGPKPDLHIAICLSACLPPNSAARGDVPHIISQLHSHVTAAAEGAGMPMRQPARQRPGRASPHQPFFDAECRSLKHQVRTADQEERGALERHYHSVVRRKKRAYKMARLQQLVDSRCLQQHSFWVKLRHHPPQLPMALQNVQSWDTGGPGGRRQAAACPFPAR